MSSAESPPQSVAQAYRLVFDQALCHASLLIERLLFYNRNLGLLPRTSSSDDPLAPIVVSDEDVATIFAGFRKLSRTEPQRRPDLLTDPLASEIAASRAALVQVLSSDDARGLGFVEIVHSLGLLDESLDPFLLALCPEWDARLGRLFGFLNNDTTRQRPTFGHLQLALQQGLPTVSVEVLDRLERLLRPGLIELDTTSDAPQPNQVVRAPGHVVELSRAVLHPREASAVRPWRALYWAEDDRRLFAAALERELTQRVAQPRLLVLEGTPGSGRRAAAAATAQALDLGVVDCPLRPEPVAAQEQKIGAAAFRARVQGALLVVRSDGVLGDRHEVWRRLAQLTRSLGVRAAVLVRPDESLPAEGEVPLLRMSPPRLYPAQRRRLWQDALAEVDLQAAAPVLDHISMRFDITPGRVHELAAEMALRRSARGARDIAVHDVGAALRDITVQKLKDQAALYIADQDLSDLILEQATRERLDELLRRMQYRYEVLDGWRFGGRSLRGHSVTALFAGPPGTGKTAAAGAVARALEIDLYIVDLSRVMSKWVGETEQNLARIFDEAEASSVALLFDEADSLFGKRSSEVKSASDRYANITVNYLLQRMERYSGLAILTTNLESAIDTAFSRRISSRVYFPEPDAEHRLLLWTGLLPPGVRFDDDVDLSEIVRLLEMPGARIRSALMRASFRAASSGRKDRVLTQQDLYWAAALEYEDMGHLPPPLTGHHGPPPPVSQPAGPPEPVRWEDGHEPAPPPVRRDFPFPKRW